MAKVDKATVNQLNAMAELNEAKRDLPLQTMLYNQSVEQSVIDNTPTPPTSQRDRAEARVRVAERMLRQTDSDLHAAATGVGELLIDEATVQEWLATIHKTIEDTSTEYLEAVAKIDTLARRRQELIGLTYLLNEPGLHIAIPFKSADPCEQLRAIAEWSTHAAGRTVHA
jgi:hypothetical protein